MARHLIIGDGTAYGTTDGLVDAGAIAIEKLAATGPVELVPGETLSDSTQIRILQGTSGANIVTPWFYGKDIINWSGKSYSAPVSQISRITWSADATNAADIEVTFKFVNTTNGNGDPFDAKSFSVSNIGTTNGNNTQQEIARLFMSQFYSAYGGSGSQSAVQSVDLPWFVKTVDTDDASSSEIEFVGWDKGETMRNGQVAEYATSFKIVQENGDGAANGGTATVTTPTPASRGYGYGEYIYEMESELMGINYGYYNRVQQPVAPTSTASKTAIYDTYNIVATKDGSSYSQINGVDNLIDITIASIAGHATTAAPHAAGVAIEDKLNPYMNSAGFATFNL